MGSLACAVWSRFILLNIGFSGRELLDLRQHYILQVLDVVLRIVSAAKCTDDLRQGSLPLAITPML